jgi:nonribosomal peptide synthetase DhbF
MLVSRIRATLGVEMQPALLFEWPSVAQLSPRLSKREKSRVALVKQQRPERLPLSYAQQRLWFLDRLGGGSREYNIPAALRLRGALDQRALEKAINAVVQRHEILRTHFEEIEGEAVQVIAAQVRLALAVEDLSGLEDERQKEEVKLALARQWEERFDLERGPLLRVKLMKLGEEEHILLRTFHHIVYDGWSDGVFHWELMELYEAFRRGEENPLPELQVQYADFTLWQRQWMKQEWLAGELGYWKQQLAGIPEGLELVTDSKRPAVQTFAGGLVRGKVSGEVTGKLKQWSRKQQATLYMTMLSGLGVLLARYSGQYDIVVGSPIANRQEAELEGLIGFFVNTLVMRVKADGGKSFEEMVGEVKRTALEGYQHQDVPFERLVEELAPQRSLNRTPLFQVVFAYQSAPPVEEEREEEESLRMEAVEENEIRVRFDLEIHVGEQDGEIRTDWIYNRDLFAPWRIQQMARHYRVVLEAVAANPQLEIGNIDLLDVNERKQILEEWNRTHRHYPHIACLTKLVEEQAECSPGAIAVTCQGEDLNYRELNDRANRLARYLIQQGVEPETRVGICVERSVEMVIGLLGIWKAAGAYVPLEPTYPDDRLKLIVKDAEIRFLVTGRQFADRYSDQPSLQLIHLDKDWEAIAQQSPENLQAQLTPDHAAYVIYTSGSTGKPKGVVVTHRSLHNLFNAVDENLHFNPSDVWTMFHSYAFDFSVWEVWGALIYGGRLVIVPYLVARAPEEFCDLVYKEGVTILSQTPSAFQHFMTAHEALDLGKKLKLRAVIFGGEKLEFQGLKKWFAQYGDGLPQMINMYGITETTIHTTYQRVTRKNLVESSGSLIGGPLANYRIYVLNEHLKPAPVGVRGELYIGGEGVARGYLNLPSLTAERFVPDPFARPGSRMYRTGDLARWNKDGNLEFGGRADQQVKIRGFRIELGEIEAALKAYPEVAQAVVIAREGRSGEKQLLGYVVPSPEATIDPATLRHRLARVLPDYMVPAAIVELDKVPLTGNGKLDVRALPNPEFQASKSYRPPRTAQEETLCSLFNKVLGLEHVGIDDNFFEIGGHSLLAIHLVSRIRATLGLELSIRNLFEAPTVAGLAARMANPILADPYEVILPIRTSGSRLPLFCIHPGLGLSSGYSALLQHIDSSQPIYGVQNRGLNDPGPLPGSIAEMGGEYLVHIRKLQPHGPYYLLGWSFGGCVAQAMASLLEKAGEEVGLLALLDSFPADRYEQTENYVNEYVQGMVAANPDVASLIRPDQYNRLNEIVSNNIRLQLLPQSFSYSGDAVLFVATTEHDQQMLADLWRPHIRGEIKTLAVACGHLEMLQPEPIAQIGKLLSTELKTLHLTKGVAESVAGKRG